ncbi:MAG: restriction endonuclease subunit S [Candidatus Jordarchaeaceae archaeon]
MKTEYKQTPIGRIPKDWEVMKLGETNTVEIIMGQSPPSSTYNERGEGLPFLQGKAEFGSVYPNPVKYTIQPLKIAEKGDIIISVRAPVGDVNLVPFKLCIGRGLSAIRIKKGSNLFYFYFFQKTKRIIENVGKGSTFKAITKNELENLFIPIPPIREQEKIAEVLSTVDDAIQKVDEAITKTERLKKGLMQKLLTKGIGHKEFKDTEIGKIPKEWQVVQLGEIVANIKNGFASGKRDENGIVQIRMNNITTDGRLLLDSYLKVPIPDRIDEWLLKENDLLFNNTNSIDLVGKSTIFKGAPFPCTFSNHFTRIRFKEKLVLPDWILYHFLIYWEKGYFRSVAIRHVGQAAVHTSYLLKLKIPMPSLSEQKRIVEMLSAVDKELELCRKRREKFERIKKGLMNDLLTGRKRVKVAG